jgi:hypothetical protein
LFLVLTSQERESILFCPNVSGVFIVFGLSGIAPATHYSIVNGWEKSINEAAIGWLILMGKSFFFWAPLSVNLRFRFY